MGVKMETLGGALLLAAIVGILVALVGLIKPSAIKLKSRKQAFFVLIGMFLLFGISGTLLPPPPENSTNTPEIKPQNLLDTPPVISQQNDTQKIASELERTKTELANTRQENSRLSTEMDLMKIDISKSQKEFEQLKAELEQSKSAESDNCDKQSKNQSDSDSDSKPPAQNETSTAETHSPENDNTDNCGGKRHCKQMSSCAEAKHYLHDCGVSSLDRNGDGVPCEKLCR